MATYVKKIDGNVIYAQRAEETGTGVNIDSALADKANKVANPQEGHFVGLDAQGELVDAGVSLGDYKTKQQPVSDPSMDGYTTAFIDTISQTDNGVITVTKKGVPTASSETAGLMSTNDKGKLDSVEYGANNYQHPTIYPSGEAPTLGLYKVALNEAGHVASVTNVVKQDIVDLGIPGSDTTYNASNGITLDGTTFKHTNNITGGTAGPGADTTGNTFTVTNVVYDDNGHITQTTTNQHTSFPLPSSDGEFLLGVTNDTSSTGSAPDWGELTKGLVGGNGILLDENNEPLLDENNNPLLDEHTAELWTEYKRTGFAAARAIADEDGNNIKNALDDKVERVFIENTEIDKTGHDVHIPMAVSESDTSNKKNGAMSSVDKYKVDAIDFVSTGDQYYQYDENNDANTLRKVGYPGDQGYGGGYAEMLYIAQTDSQSGNNDEIWVGSIRGLNDNKVGFYSYVGPSNQPEDYRNPDNWEPYYIDTIEKTNTIDTYMVYLNTSHGNDDNDGLTVDTPVRTADRAYWIYRNTFGYDAGNNVRIRVLNNNATVTLDNVYDTAPHAFDYIAFYGIGNVTFVYNLDADDRGKFVDGNPKNGLWAEFDGNVSVVAASHAYCRQVHVVSKYGNVTFSGPQNTIGAYSPSIYAMAASNVVWNCNSEVTPSQVTDNAAVIFFSAGHSIQLNYTIKCMELHMYVDHFDVYEKPSYNTATAGIYLNSVNVTVSYMMCRSDYVSMNSASEIHSSGQLIFSQVSRERMYSDFSNDSKCMLKLLGSIYGATTGGATIYPCDIMVRMPDGIIMFGESSSNSPDEHLRHIDIECFWFKWYGTPTQYSGGRLYVDSKYGIDIVGEINLPNDGQCRLKSGGFINASTNTIRTGMLDITRCTGMSYPGDSLSVFNVYASTVLINGGVTPIWIGNMHVSDTCTISTGNNIGIQNTNTISTLVLNCNNLTLSGVSSIGQIQLRCSILNIDDGRFELYESLTPDSTPISLTARKDNVIEIGKLINSSQTPSTQYGAFCVDRENVNISANVMESNSILFLASYAPGNANTYINAKINMNNAPVFVESSGSPDLGDPSHLYIKVVSDFDTDGTTPATVTGYNDYQYVVVSNVTAVNIHTQTLNS